MPVRVCVISGVTKDSKVLPALSAHFAQACEFYVCNADWLTPVPGLGPELCHDRIPGPSLPHPRGDCVRVTVAHGVTSVQVQVIISWWAYCSSAPALGCPLFPSTDTRVVAVVLRVTVLHTLPPGHPGTEFAPAGVLDAALECAAKKHLDSHGSS